MLHAYFVVHEGEVALFKEFVNCFCVCASTTYEYDMGYVHPLSLSVLTSSWYLNFWRCIVGVGSWSWQKVNSVKTMLEFWVA